MITSNNIAPPATDGIQFIHDPSIDQRFVVIIQPCKSIMLGRDESLQPTPPSALLEGSGELLLQYPVWHLEFGTRAVKVISSITACDALTCFASPFLVNFYFVIYVTDCLSVIMSVWTLLSVMFAKPRIITNLNTFRRQIIFGNFAKLHLYDLRNVYASGIQLAVMGQPKRFVDELFSRFQVSRIRL